MEPRISFITLGVADVQRATRCADLDGFLWKVAYNPDFPHV
jgi:hypothetical protein